MSRTTISAAHESLRRTPASAQGLTDHAWSIRELIDAAPATQPIKPEDTPAKRRSRFKAIQGDLFD